MADARERDWDLVITPKRDWFEVDLLGVWRYRDLALLLFKRDFVALYKQTILGPLWYLIQPTLTTVVFTLIFNRIAQIPTDGTPPFLFYMVGIVLWNYFAGCLVKTSDTFTSSAGIFSKVYFPRLVVPVSVVLSNLLTFVIQFALVLCVMLAYWLSGARLDLGAQLVIVIPLVIYVALLGLGVGTVVSSLTTKYRDLAFLVGFATQLWMYATPIAYPLSEIPQKWQWLFWFNPMTAPAESFKLLLLGAGSPTVSMWLANVGIGAVLMFLGLVLFSRVEKTSMDTV